MPRNHWLRGGGGFPIAATCSWIMSHFLALHLSCRRDQADNKTHSQEYGCGQQNQPLATRPQVNRFLLSVKNSPFDFNFIRNSIQEGLSTFTRANRAFRVHPIPGKLTAIYLIPVLNSALIAEGWSATAWLIRWENLPGDYLREPGIPTPVSGCFARVFHQSEQGKNEQNTKEYRG